jgi:uncharacterized protein YggE
MTVEIFAERRGALMRYCCFVLIATVALFASPTPKSMAAEAASSNVHVIEVSGDGEAQVAPDKATLNLGIETQAKTAGQAAGDNGALAQKVRDAIKAKLDDKGVMWTGGYSLDPVYSQPRDGGEPKIMGYRAVNSITIETGALDLVGPLIDAAIGAGANQVNSLEYGLRDETKARNDAIAKASESARAQAQSLASALGIKLGPVIKASTIAEARPVPVFAKAAMPMIRSGATPVEAGQITVPATVSLIYEIQ